MIIGLGIFLWLLIMAWKGRFTPEWHTRLRLAGCTGVFRRYRLDLLVSVALSDRPASMRFCMSAHSSATSSPLKMYFGVAFLHKVGTGSDGIRRDARSGRYNALVALGIATIKATLVALFFMHVWHASEKLTKLS